MKVSSILVISVIIKLHYRVIFRSICSLYMKVSDILVISVIIKLRDRVIFRVTYQLSTLTQFSSVTPVTIKQSGDQSITNTRNVMSLWTEEKNSSSYPSWLVQSLQSVADNEIK